MARFLLVRWLLRSLVIFAVVSAVGLFYGYTKSFVPHLDELESFANRGHAAAGEVEGVLYSLAVAAEPEDGIRTWAIRQAYSTLVVKKTGSQRTIPLQLNIALWIFVSNINLSDEQIFGLWVDCALYSCGRGFQEAAHEQFGKELKELSKRELAGLVAMVKNPSVFRPGTLRGDQRARKIIEKEERTIIGQ